MSAEGRVRVIADVPPGIKARLDKKVHWGLRNDFLSAILSDVVDGLERDDKDILVGLIIARKVHITWDVEGAISDQSQRLG